MLPVAYDPILVTSSVLVAIMAAFTGLRLASGLRHHSIPVRKQQIAKAAIALGGGIWSMHFVGMLAVQLPVDVRYEALPILGSALIAILMTGLGLLALHFGERSRLRIVLAGVMTGLGIIAMHYVGMSAIVGNCIVVFEGLGYVIAGTISVASSIAAFWMAYHRRSLRQLVIGAVLLGLTVSAVHYSAMIYTNFLPVEVALQIQAPNLSTGVLALIVAFAAFLVCGLFLFSTIPNEPPQTALAGSVPGEAGPEAIPQDRSPAEERAAPPDGAPISEPSAEEMRLPVEEKGATRFIPVSNVRMVRADGHYTWLHDGASERFCPRSISKLYSDLKAAGFLQTHRSYLASIEHITGFERDGEKTYCVIDGAGGPRIPVSRSRIKTVRDALKLA